MREFLQGLLANTIASSQKKVEDDTDFFLLGLDSLQAIQMRSEILKSVELGGRHLGQNIDAASTAVEKEMQALINKYGDISATTASAVVVTGAAGSLGAYDVSKLASNPDIATTLCLVRAPTKSQALFA
ncbi:NRPS-like enzyme [Cordyceps fumosorosea ARSEF 2679]|uniref:NRPS-like enzyme n=1 Tax=Cordyceps fumosorosea (strain ARSEF 2679) TaxID=1081104 RepID=A0A167E9Y6_CORFA|nr:NRPS-like enzyme [Cordyceps fumosorosea ARSEF 2679]OAA43562.1 NRPS-like enzyme [Cordyceps fumosorosea ARSEF 2679]